MKEQELNRIPLTAPAHEDLDSGSRAECGPVQTRHFMTLLHFKSVLGRSAQENQKIMRYRSIKPLLVDAVQVHGPADIPTDGGVLHAAAGDWIIRDPHGNVKLCNDRFFRTNYTLLGVGSPIEELKEKGNCGGC